MIYIVVCAALSTLCAPSPAPTPSKPLREELAQEPAWLVYVVIALVATAVIIVVLAFGGVFNL